MLFRTRRRDECSRLKKGVRRRVRKSRQKEAAGAADAELMQSEWGEGEVLKLAGDGTEAEREVGRVWQRESMVENGLTEGAK